MMFCLKFAVFVATIGMAVYGCGHDSKGFETESKIEPGLFNWSPSRIASNAPSRKEFESDAEAMVKRLPTFRQSKSTRLFLNINGVFDQIEREGTVILESEIKGRNAVPIEVTVVARGSSTNRVDAFNLMKKALVDLENAFTAMSRIWNGDDATWLRTLDSPEPDEQILASRLLASRKKEEYVVPISKLLYDPREQVAEAAAEALCEMGYQQAVPLLIKSVDPNSLRSEVRAIESMAKIGGNEARAYLEMIADGHEVEEVRAIAKDALKRMVSTKR